MADGEDRPEICERLKHLRESVFGERGRAAFARALDVSPSTYNYYEKGRRPPADLVARAAEVTGADLQWLLAGRGEAFPETGAGGDTQVSPRGQDVLRRLRRELAHHPQTPAAERMLGQVLEEMSRTFPQDKKPPLEPARLEDRPTTVPILGRTAAGLVADWDAWFEGEDDPAVLEGLMDHLAGREVREGTRAVDRPDPGAAADTPPDAGAMLIQLAEPTPEGVAELVDLPWLDSPDPRLFGLRIDGDSMAPRIEDGDVVVCRRGEAPLPGQTAVVKLRGGVGVTCKLWRPADEKVHLVPINEMYDPIVRDRDDVVWAVRVVWVVRA